MEAQRQSGTAVVSTHAPTKGATYQFDVPAKEDCFNPRPHEGGDSRAR